MARTWVRDRLERSVLVFGLLRLGQAVAVPVVVGALLWLWYWEGQQGAEPPVCYTVCDSRVLFGFSGTAGTIEDSAMRVISHRNEDHLIGNLWIIAATLPIIAATQKLRTGLAQLLVLFSGAVVVYSFYESIIGASVFTYGLIALVWYAVLVYLWPPSSYRERSVPEQVVLVFLVLYLLYGTIASNIHTELLFTIGYYDLFDLGIGNPAVDTPAYYGPESAEVHAYGFVSGVLTGLLTAAVRAEWLGQRVSDRLR